MKLQAYPRFGLSWILLLSIVLPSFLKAADPDAHAQLRFEARLNELLLWRLSDELELKPIEERELKQIIGNYQYLRKNALDQQEISLKKMEEALKKKSAPLQSEAKHDPQSAQREASCTGCLLEYEKASKLLIESGTKELAELKKLLGPKRVEKFLVIRRRMTMDVREALKQAPAVASPSSQKSAAK